MADKVITTNEKNGKTMEQLQADTEMNSQYIQQCGYQLVEMWECEWKQMKNQNPDLRHFLRRFRRTLDYKQTMTQEQVLEAVKETTLFGMVECNINVPEDLRSHFEEMTPIFKNTKVCLDDIGEPMKTYAEQNQLMFQPRRSLIGSYHGEKILLATPLLQWYLEH